MKARSFVHRMHRGSDQLETSHTQESSEHGSNSNHEGPESRCVTPPHEPRMYSFEVALAPIRAPHILRPIIAKGTIPFCSRKTKIVAASSEQNLKDKRRAHLATPVVFLAGETKNCKVEHCEHPF